MSILLFILIESNLDSRFILDKNTLHRKGVSQPVAIQTFLMLRWAFYSKLVLRRHFYRKAIKREH